jgi:hypothetical protein
MLDSRELVEKIIYDKPGILKNPDKMNDLYSEIRYLVEMYKASPEWDDEFKEDIREYVGKCINMLEKM